jgi:CubicO group peptidase (beta-lactamase class C family)
MALAPLGCSLSMPPRPSTTARGSPAAALDSYARKFVRRYRVPGLALHLGKNGTSLLHRGYGFRDVAARLPVTPRTVFGIASVTKSFTALAILRLQEDKRLRVNDPVQRHLPEFRVPGARTASPIRLHHFLTHTSGLPPLPSIYYTSGRSIARDPPYDPRRARAVGIDPDHPAIDTYEGLLRYLATERYRLLGPPGAQFSYSNEGFGLLGAVIERASGRTYEAYLDEAVLRPAGLRSTTFDTGIMFRLPEVTTLYSPKRRGRGRGWVASQEWWEDTCLRSAGALRTNLDDLSRYVEIFRTGGRVDGETIVRPASLRAMTHPHIEVTPGVYYGYGVAVQPSAPGGPVVSHSGGLKGVSSQFFVQPQRGTTSVALVNLEMVPSNLVTAAGLNLLLGRTPRAPLTPLPAPQPAPASLSEYAGYYCSGEGVWCTARPVRGRLRLDFIGIEYTWKDFRLRPLGADQFARGAPGRPSAYVRFYRDARGRVKDLFFGWRHLRRRRRAELRLARRGRMVW